MSIQSSLNQIIGSVAGSIGTYKVLKNTDPKYQREQAETRAKNEQEADTAAKIDELTRRVDLRKSTLGKGYSTFHKDIHARNQKNAEKYSMQDFAEKQSFLKGQAEDYQKLYKLTGDEQYNKEYSKAFTEMRFNDEYAASRKQRKDQAAEQEALDTMTAEQNRQRAQEEKLNRIKLILSGAVSEERQNELLGGKR